MALTSEAKKLLAETIRGTQQDPEKGLRARLLRTIHDEADRRYRLSVPLAKAGLDEAHRKRRERIEAWVDERARASKPKNKAELKAAEERLLREAEKEAAATLLNRMILLRQLEALGLSKPAVVTGGWNSKGYRELCEFAPALTHDETEGYAMLLQLLFDELAIDLPGLFGEVGLTRLFPIPAAMLREVVERLDNPALSSAWTDDTTLGWVYQYWNDPDREALDAKINSGGKIQPHEIASKTQMFTERYMVEWLLQNSLGLMWLCICKKNGWKADAEKVLPILEARRAEWRKKREAGEVALDALMPIEGELEDHWKYYVLQPIPGDAVKSAPESVRTLKILDPACGSGHFLVIAFGLLAALYREEARNRGQTITDREVAESILENNLFGIDIDPRAIQIAAAALYLKTKSVAKDARPKTINLVAPVLQLGNLPPDDPALVEMRRELKREAGISEELTNKIVTSLAGVDHLGSLLKVSDAVKDAIRSAEVEFEQAAGQGDLFKGFGAQQVKLSIGRAKATILDKLEQFLARHSRLEDLGLRLQGEQLAAGVRFVRMAREGVYDLVVANPPYSDTSLLADASYIKSRFPAGKSNIYAAFLERAPELVREEGICALLTMRGWMFQLESPLRSLRKNLLRSKDIRILADLDSGAFDEVSAAQVVLSVVMTVFRRSEPSLGPSVALRPTAQNDRASAGMTSRKRAGLLSQVGRYEFDTRGFEVIKGEPIVYWWQKSFLARYASAPKLGEVSPVRQGLGTRNDTRFLRLAWEVQPSRLLRVRFDKETTYDLSAVVWVPNVKGAAGRVWFEPLSDVVFWQYHGLHVRTWIEEYRRKAPGQYIKNEAFYFLRGIAFSMIGSEFSARAHRYRSIFGEKGSSVFPEKIPETLCLMNSSFGRYVLESLNPTICFQVGDVVRMPFIDIRWAEDIYRAVERAFSEHEATRENSVEFSHPGPSAWRDVQQWAQRAVDLEAHEPLPPYEPRYEPPNPASFLSFAVGVALGRFGANGEGVLDVSPPSSLPVSMLFLSYDGRNGLDHPACLPLHAAWKEHGSIVGEGDDLCVYLRKSFFDYHKKVYENRPIYFPLSSAKKSFVAFALIHRWRDDTLNVLLADHLMPEKRRLEGELDDLRTARATAANKGKAEKRFTEIQKLLEELNEFIAKVTEIAEKGPPPPDDKIPSREVDARYVMDLDDGVMVNSAALWPLLEPQWKDPKKWWKELATAQGRKDYDWSHLAARYFPTRVQQKCHDDPSLAVAHKCFWTLHPAKAYAWELRLQDEIRPDFTIDEPGSDEARAKFLAEQPRQAAEIRAAEIKRRERKAAKADDDSEAGPLFDRDAPDDPDEPADD